MLLLFVLGAFVVLASSLPVDELKQQELREREIVVLRHSPTLVKRDTQGVVDGQGQIYEASRAPPDNQTGSKRAKRGLKRRLKKTWGKIRKGVKSGIKKLGKIWPKQPVPIFTYKRTF
uniref:Uncharacterized protein n=1 Tax=Trichuris muris TaxID=70415 RepID=A0A5S6Q890_TRIMR